MGGSTPFTLLLLLNIFCLVHSTNYYFIFEGKFHCDILNRQFQYNVQFFDEDYMWWNDDDPITEPYKDISPPGDSYFRSKGMLDGDEWMVEAFDIKMVLYHTCTQTGQENRVDMRFRPSAQNSYNLDENKYYRYDFATNITELSGEKIQMARLYKSGQNK
ncbi:hypothetical protein GCK72_013322 [Caenorhabditis remanei]|uniref:Uncharacterized protein n=1 Tax=Caenorhabditis remanei TaxID=31234 RepID=A0A6A5GNA4_CAERE|nr:hypothetical protein GCK72_013322 [Caenorhabditis remanei]KAF1756868.1 hypothetical protein GCK72_013322 [Caenorhabditis remanei]